MSARGEGDSPAVVEVDGRRFAVHIGGPGAPMEVDVGGGERARFSPWTLEDHLSALERRVNAGGGEVRFDHEGFARDVLARSGVRPALYDELAPLALWWAAGGASSEGVAAPDGVLVFVTIVKIGRAIAKIRPWTFAERAKALSESVVTRPDGAKELRIDRYLRAMLEASVVSIEPPNALETDNASGLLDAVAAINAAGDGEEDRRARAGDAAGRAFAEATLRVCRALGMTPSQVWAMPAAEIDRVLMLLDATGASAAEPAVKWRRPSLADHPDAVVIRLEDG